jgi:hypothetical protein
MEATAVKTAGSIPVGVGTFDMSSLAMPSFQDTVKQVTDAVLSVPTRDGRPMDHDMAASFANILRRVADKLIQAHTNAPETPEETRSAGHATGGMPSSANGAGKDGAPGQGFKANTDAAAAKDESTSVGAIAVRTGINLHVSGINASPVMCDRTSPQSRVGESLVDMHDSHGFGQSTHMICQEPVRARRAVSQEQLAEEEDFWARAGIKW